MSFISELKRRNVLRTALGYLAASWLLIQIAETIFPVFDLSTAPIRVIVIVLAIGFAPMLVLSWIMEWTPEGFKKDTGVATGRSIVTQHAKTWDRIVLLVLALALGLFAFDKFVLAPQRESTLVEEATQAGAEQALAQERAKEAEILHESIAVLPFVNMSGDPDNEYFSDGLTETLLHMLSQLQDLQVSARTSSFAFKGKNVDIRTIAKELGVAHVLEGSVQKSGNLVRITAQLIRAEDGFHLWSQNYDRDLDNIFAIQDEIAKEVADALGSSLLAASDGAIKGVATSDVSVYDIYLQGLEKYRLKHDASLQEADVLFRQALEMDPGFHDARLALALNNIWREYQELVPLGVTLEESHDLVTHVVNARPDDLVSQSLLTFFEIQIMQVDTEKNRRKEIQEHFDQLLVTFSLGYGDPYVRRATANFLRVSSRLDEAYALIRDGLRYDPLNTDLLLALSGNYQFENKWEEALQPLLTVNRLMPGNALILEELGNLEGARGNVSGEMDWMRQAIEADPSDSDLVWSMAVRLYDLGMPEHARYWNQLSRTIGGGNPQDPAYLDLYDAKSRNDDNLIIELAVVEIERVLADDALEAIGFFADEYTMAMHRQGRSEEAGDFLKSLYPDVFDVSKLPAHGELFTLQYSAWQLYADLVSTEEFREQSRTYEATADAAGVVWRENRPVVMYVELKKGNFDVAKEIFMNEFSDRAPNDFIWGFLIETPWLGELRADMEIAMLISKRNREMVEIRKELNEMFLEPEWQF